jgi:hypothetical protein
VSTNGDRPAEDGFEYQGSFYRWHVTTVGKDLMLIDRFSGLPVQEFFRLIEDDFDRGRVPVLLTMIATSIRNVHPDWTVERIVRLVLDLDVAELLFVEADTEADTLPPASAEPAASTGTGSSSASKPTPSAPPPATSATSSKTLV